MTTFASWWSEQQTFEFSEYKKVTASRNVIDRVLLEAYILTATFNAVFAWKTSFTKKVTEINIIFEMDDTQERSFCYFTVLTGFCCQSKNVLFYYQKVEIKMKKKPTDLLEKQIFWREKFQLKVRIFTVVSQYNLEKKIFELF